MLVLKTIVLWWFSKAPRETTNTKFLTSYVMCFVGWKRIPVCLLSTPEAFLVRANPWPFRCRPRDMKDELHDFRRSSSVLFWWRGPWLPKPSLPDSPKYQALCRFFQLLWHRSRKPSHSSLVVLLQQAPQFWKFQTSNCIWQPRLRSTFSYILQSNVYDPFKCLMLTVLA